MITASPSAAGLLAAAVDRVELERRIEFESLPAGWARVAGLLGAALLLWVVVWMYRREGRAGASLRVRTFLAALRCLVLLILLGICLEPVLATYVTRWVESYSLLLIDDSASMDLADRYRDEQRAQRVARVLGRRAEGPVRRMDLVERLLSNENGRLLGELTARNRVRVFSFAESLEPVCTLSARRERPANNGLRIANSELNTGNGPTDAQLDIGNVLQFSARGSATKAARALRRALEQMSGAPIAGGILLTDGGFTESDALQSLASIAREHDVPLHLVGIGDPSQPLNVRVVELSAPESVFARDPFQITAHLSATGLAGRPIEVALYERPADGIGGPKQVETRQVTVASDGTLGPITFTRPAPRVGRWIYRAEVPLEQYESVADDNSKQKAVNVIDSRLRVLLVAGSPSWEYRYLSRLLQRDASFEVSCWLQSADVQAVRDGNTIIDHLPATAEELFAYDVVVLLDPDPQELTRNWCELAARLVSEYGGGLLFGAARLYTSSLLHDDRVQPLLDLLPVALDPQADLILNRIGHYQDRRRAVTIPETSLGHPVLKLADDPAGNRLAWQGLGDIYWHYPVLREKPVATVLMRHGDARMANAYGGHVLAATQFVGAGRTAFLAFDGTWRWRRYGEELFDGFWVRMLRYLVEGKLPGSKSRGLILTDSDNYQLGVAVTVQARVFDERFDPLLADEVKVSYRVEQVQREFTLQAAPDRPGWFEGRFVPDRTGNYEIALQVPVAGGGSAPMVRREIQVSRPNVEILRPEMNRAGLVSLAAAVEQGRYYEIDQAGRIPQVIPDRHETTTVRSRPSPLWDTWWVLVMLIGLLSVEWAGRKWARLL